MKKEKKPNDGLNLALTLCVIFAVLFTICMIVIFCIYQSTPDVLIGAVFAALFGELGCCTMIYKIKFPKIFDDATKEEIEEDPFSDLTIEE